MKEEDELRVSLMSAKEVLDSIKNSFLVGNKDNSFSFTSVTTDSRTVKKNSLFVPLIGENQDGHIYIPQAIESGASIIFVADSEYKNKKDYYDDLVLKNINLNFVIVNNTLQALQSVATGYVNKFPNLIKIGITGSSGKTTTKEMVVSVLKQKFNVVYTQGNFNSETGLPLSVFNIKKEHEVGVFEMGMNRVNEIGEISAVLKAKYALITNIGTAHIGILGSRKNIATEKRKIFDFIPSSGVAFIPAEDDFCDFLGENVRGTVTYYGTSVPQSNSGAKFIKDCGLDGTVFDYEGEEIHIKNPGLYNYKNALGACAIGRTLGLTPKQIKTGLESLSHVSGRMERLNICLKNKAHISLIKDCYNANPDSMMSVLDFCSSLGDSKNDLSKKILVLGDMLELGESSIDEHKKVIKKAFSLNPKLAIFVGKEINKAYEAIEDKPKNIDVRLVPTHDEKAVKESADFILDIACENDLILLKASHGISLERIIPFISDEE